MNLCHTYNLTELDTAHLKSLVALAIFGTQIKHAQLTELGLLQVVVYGKWGKRDGNWGGEQTVSANAGVLLGRFDNSGNEVK